LARESIANRKFLPSNVLQPHQEIRRGDSSRISGISD
jgi:hypothetical protein